MFTDRFSDSVQLTYRIRMLVTFWCSAKEESPKLVKIKTLFLLPRTHLREVLFALPASTKTHRSRLNTEAGMKTHLSSLKPDFFGLFLKLFIYLVFGCAVRLAGS